MEINKLPFLTNNRLIVILNIQLREISRLFESLGSDSIAYLTNYFNIWNETKDLKDEIKLSTAEASLVSEFFFAEI